MFISEEDDFKLIQFVGFQGLIGNPADFYIEKHWNII